jgi:outer membrane protein assembly factor BamE (lipoprotein component of BamABCDE complex)
MMFTTTRTRKKVISAAALGIFLSLAACSPQFRNHGYVPPQADLDLIEVGSDTRESVAEKVGIPSSSGILNDSGYYYVRMRTRTIGPLAREPIEREVVAISFSSNGVVQNIERFGMERGQVVPLSRRVTSSAVSDRSFIRQLLGNLGRFRPAGLGG